MPDDKKPRISVRGIKPDPKSVAGFKRFDQSTLDEKQARIEAQAARVLTRLAAVREAGKEKDKGSRDFYIRTHGAVVEAVQRAVDRGNRDPRLLEHLHLQNLLVTRPGARSKLRLPPLAPQHLEMIRQLGLGELLD